MMEEIRKIEDSAEKKKDELASNKEEESEKSIDNEYDLEPSLLRLGWRKYLSKRENRFYYYNKLTNESYWSLNEIKMKSIPNWNQSPSISSQTSQRYIVKQFKNSSHIFLSSSSSCYSPSLSDKNLFSSPSQSDVSYGELRSPEYEKKSRRYSSSVEDSVEEKRQSKRSKKNKEWDLYIKSDAVTFERPMNLMLPPHPDIEIERFKYFKDELSIEFINIISQSLKELSSKEKILIQNDLFFWLIELKLFCLNYKSYEALFIEDDTSLDIEIFSFELLKEIVYSIYLNELNEKSINKNEDTAQKQFKTFGDIMKEFLISLDYDLNNNNINNEKNPDLDKLLEYIEYNNINDINDTIKKEVEKYMINLIKKRIKDQLKLFIKNNIKVSNRLLNDHKKLYENKIKIATEPPEYKIDKKIMCYPILMCTSSVFLPAPIETYDRTNSIIYLKYNDESLKIRVEYIGKLKQLYAINCKDDPKKALFLPRVWCLLKRYDLINNADGVKFYSLKADLIDHLVKKFCVTFELFSTPLTSYFAQYCSFFPDIDSYFGSRGTLFNFKTLNGTFLAALPFSEILIEKFLNQIEDFLTLNKEFLMFIVIIPLYRNGNILVEKCKKSRFMMENIILSHKKNIFDSFFKYKELNVLTLEASSDTFIAIYQNEHASLSRPVRKSDLEHLRSI